MATDWGRLFGGRPDAAKITGDRVSVTGTRAREGAERLVRLTGMGRTTKKRRS